MTKVQQAAQCNKTAACVCHLAVPLTSCDYASLVHCFALGAWGQRWSNLESQHTQRRQTMVYQAKRCVHVPVQCCPCSPGNNAAVRVMEGPTQPLPPPQLPGTKWGGGGGGGGGSTFGALLRIVYFCVCVFLCVFHLSVGI